MKSHCACFGIVAILCSLAVATTTAHDDAKDHGIIGKLFDLFKVCVTTAVQSKDTLVEIDELYSITGKLKAGAATAATISVEAAAIAAAAATISKDAAIAAANIMVEVNDMYDITGKLQAGALTAATVSAEGAVAAAATSKDAAVAAVTTMVELNDIYDITGKIKAGAFTAATISAEGAVTAATNSKDVAVAAATTMIEVNEMYDITGKLKAGAITAATVSAEGAIKAATTSKDAAVAAARTVVEVNDMYDITGKLKAGAVTAANVASLCAVASLEEVRLMLVRLQELLLHLYRQFGFDSEDDFKRSREWQESAHESFGGSRRQGNSVCRWTSPDDFAQWFRETLAYQAFRNARSCKTKKKAAHKVLLAYHPDKFHANFPGCPKAMSELAMKKFTVEMSRCR